VSVPPVPEAAKPADLEVARSAARAHERDRYLAALLARGQVRDDLIVLAAFAGEVAHVPSLVSEPMIGEIRLQWWREALEAPGERGRSGHPVADLMRGTVERHRLPLGLLIGFIDAQALGLGDGTLPDDEALRSYLARTEGALFELALRIVGRGAGGDRALIVAAGQAYGLARMLTGLASLHARGRTLIPAARLDAVGLPPATISSEDATVRLTPVIREFTAEARQALGAARQAIRSLSRAQRVAVLPLALVEPYLRALESVADPLRESRALTPLERAWPLLRAYWSGRL
jgi:phytoene synthase